MEAIIEKIKSGDDSVVRDLDSLKGEYFLGEGKDSLFNLAIRFNHTPAVDYFVCQKNLINLIPKINDDAKKSAKNMSSQGVDLTSAEQAIFRSFGEFTSFGRTPLMQACRYGCTDTIEKLMAAGSKTKGKDALGYTPSELCLESSTSNILSVFIDSCILQSQKPSISGTVLYSAVCNSSLYEKLISHCDLDANAKRFVFSLACAYLDIEKVKSLIDQGYKVESMVAEFYNPVYEACTSSLLHKLKLTGHQRLSPLFIQHNIFSSDTNAVELDRLLAADTPVEYDSIVQGGVKQPAAGQLEEREFPWIPKHWLEEQMEKRLELVELLLKNKIPVNKTTQHCSNGLIEDVALLGSIALLNLLEKYGFDMEVEDEEELAFIANQLCPKSREIIVPYLQQFLD